MYARVAQYQLKPGSGQEVARRAEEGMLPIFQQHAGFHSYSIILTENDSCFSITIWDSEDEADAANQVAADWVRQNLAGFAESVQNHVGEVAFTGGR